METRTSPNAHYLPTLDGWRGIAIFIVLLNHDTIHSFGRFSTEWFHGHGRLGVDIFFALSGILICTRLQNEEQQTGSLNLKKFYLRRLFRIQPAAWSYLITITLLMMCGVLEHAYTGIADAFLLVRNYLPLHPSVAEWYTGHFWSLSVEEHFYLFLPGFLVLVRRKRVTLLASLVALVIVWQTVQRQHPPLQFGSAFGDHTDVAINGILIAAAFAILLRRPDVRQWCEQWLHPWVGVGFALGLLVLRQYVNRPFLEPGLYVAYVLMIVSTMLHPHTITGKVLEWPVLKFVGRISYSIYLWQMLFFTHHHEIPAPHSALLTTIQNSMPLRYGATLLVSLASFYLIETPCIRLGHRITAGLRTHRVSQPSQSEPARS